MPQLALNDRQRDPLAGELDSVSMAELMWGKSTAHTGSGGVAAQLIAHRGRRPRPPAGRAVDHAEERANGQLNPAGDPGSEMIRP
jgi:hypothetical protein